MDNTESSALKYHTESKHHRHRYAKGPDTLDFATQPVPFSKYSGSALLPLPLLRSFPEHSLSDLYGRATGAPAPVTPASVASLLELSLGLSAWKSFNSSAWALRVNPSSGNLHPTEAHLLLPTTNGTKEENSNSDETASIPGGLYHYAPYTHSLERRVLLESELNAELCALTSNNSFLIGLTTIHWREVWKYGERAWRYCSLDIGHAIGSISYAASLLGWQASYISNCPDKETARLLGLDRTKWHEHEREEPELLLHIHPCAGKEQSTAYTGIDLRDIIDKVAKLKLTGTPEPLSSSHQVWPGIEEVAKATEKLAESNREEQMISETRAYTPYPEYHRLGTPETGRSAAEQIRLRRSAQAYDPYVGTDSTSLFAMLDRTVPRLNRPPFDALGTAAKVHLLLFVHRVGGIKRGLYLLVRNPTDLQELKKSCPTGLWQPVKEAPTELGLYLLKEGDYKAAAKDFSCAQDITADSAFSLGMLANIKKSTAKEPHAYRRLFWEAGLIGQVLYLEATSIGFSGTGIGCFHDDSVLEAAGFSDTFEPLYHFTVGRAIEDERIQTTPPYAHLDGQ